MNRNIKVLICVLLVFLSARLAQVGAQGPEISVSEKLSRLGKIEAASRPQGFSPQGIPPWAADDLPAGPDSNSLDLEPTQNTGGPDIFGYTWNDTQPFTWIDATRGTDSGLNDDDAFLGPVSLGFNFPFYENSYTTAYISTNGLLTFGRGTTEYANLFIPHLRTPNNYVAPFWDDLVVGAGRNNGKVYYLHGGTAPNRYFVVEWVNVSRYETPQQLLTFEVILFENGTIIFLYHTMAGVLTSATIGVEDAHAWDGLRYSRTVSNNTAVRVGRPGSAARFNAAPEYQGHFVRGGEQTQFELLIKNTSDGIDVFNLSGASVWPLAFYHEDGVTPLTDTNGDGAIDTKVLPPRTEIKVMARFQVPTNAIVGASNKATVTIRSSRDANKRKVLNLQAAVPTSFAQVYRDNAEGAMNIYLARPQSQRVRTVTASNYYGRDLAVAEMTNNSFIYVWRKNRCLDSGCRVYVQELEHTIVNSNGDILRNAQKLTDYSTSVLNSVDFVPVVAVAPNGRIGVLWSRYLYNNDTDQLNYNVFFAVLSPTGELLSGPTNITLNDAWGTFDDVGFPGFFSPRIGVSQDNRFFLSWTREHQEAGGWVDDVYYTVRNSSNNTIQDVLKLTADTAGFDTSYFTSGWAALAENRMLLLFEQGGQNADVLYTVVDNRGTQLIVPINLSRDEEINGNWGADAVQLPNGNIFVGWTGAGQARYALLDSNTYQIKVQPATLANPAARTGSGYISVAADSENRAILAWMDLDLYTRYNLYYALVDGNGNVVTSPMIFLSGQAEYPSIETSFHGYGTTSLLATIASRTTLYVPTLRKDILPAQPTPTPIVQNGDMERGSLDGWSAGGPLPQIVVETDVYAGRYAVLLGNPALGPGNAPTIPSGEGWIEQTINVPPSGNLTHLTFWYRVVSYDVLTSQRGQIWDTFDITADDTNLIFRAGNPATEGQGTLYDSDWQQGRVDLSAYKGRRVKLRFSVFNREYDVPADGLDVFNTWVYIDNIALAP